MIKLKINKNLETKRIRTEVEISIINRTILNF